MVNKTKEYESQIAAFKQKIKNLENANKAAQVDDESEKSQELKILDSKSLDEFEIISDIGYGSSGKVVKVSKKKYYALKILSSETITSEKLRSLLKEWEIMNMLNHPNILKSLGIFFSDEKRSPAILLEYCNMNLSDAIKNKMLSNVQIVCAIYQIVEGMKYIHFMKIIHRDLKPSNILIAENGTIKICDFGNSRLMTPEEYTMTMGIGTSRFMAPEIIAEADNYNEKVDIYSFGVLVFFILSQGELPKIKIPQILNGEKASIPSSTFTKSAKNLIRSCWNFDPKDRPSFNDISKLMQKECCQLLKLSNGEIKEVQEFIENNQKLIPNYDH